MEAVELFPKFEDVEFPIVDGCDADKCRSKELRLKDLHKYLCEEPSERAREDDLELAKRARSSDVASERSEEKIEACGLDSKVAGADCEDSQDVTKVAQPKAPAPKYRTRYRDRCPVAEEQRFKRKGRINLKKERLPSSKLRDIKYPKIRKKGRRPEEPRARKKGRRPVEPRARKTGRRLEEPRARKTGRRLEEPRARKTGLPHAELGARKKGVRHAEPGAAKVKVKDSLPTTRLQNVENRPIDDAFVDVPLEESDLKSFLSERQIARAKGVFIPLASSESSGMPELTQQMNQPLNSVKPATNPARVSSQLTDSFNISHTQLIMDIVFGNHAVEPSVETPPLSCKVDGLHRPRRCKTIVNYYESLNLDTDTETCEGTGPSSGSNWKLSSYFPKVLKAKKLPVDTKTTNSRRKPRLYRSVDGQIKHGPSIFKSAYRSEDPTSDVDRHSGNRDSENPVFVSEMKRSNVIICFWLGIPAWFAKSCLPATDHIVVLEDEKGLNWEANYLVRKSGLSGGWRRFSLDHRLQEGDTLLFELVKPLKFKVHITRVSEGGTAIVVSRDSVAQLRRSSNKAFTNDRRAFSEPLPIGWKREQTERCADGISRKKFRFGRTSEQTDSERAAPISIPLGKKRRRLILSYEEDDEEEPFVWSAISTAKRLTGNDEATLAKGLENGTGSYDCDSVTLQVQDRPWKGVRFLTTKPHHMLISSKEEITPLRSVQSRQEDYGSVVAALTSQMKKLHETRSFDEDDEILISAILRPKNGPRVKESAQEGGRVEKYSSATTLPRLRCWEPPDMMVPKRSALELEAKFNAARVCVADKIAKGPGYASEKVTSDEMGGRKFAYEETDWQGFFEEREMTAEGATESTTGWASQDEGVKLDALEEMVVEGCAPGKIGGEGFTSKLMVAESLCEKMAAATGCASEDIAASMVCSSAGLAPKVSTTEMAVTGCAPDETAARFFVSGKMPLIGCASDENVGEGCASEETECRGFILKEMGCEAASLDTAAEVFVSEMAETGCASEANAGKGCIWEEMETEFSITKLETAGQGASEQMAVTTACEVEDMAATIVREVEDVAACASDEMAVRGGSSEMTTRLYGSKEKAVQDYATEETAVIEGYASKEKVVQDCATEETVVITGYASGGNISGGRDVVAHCSASEEMVASGYASKETAPKVSISQNYEFGFTDALLTTTKTSEMPDNDTLVLQGPCSCNPCTPPRLERDGNVVASPTQSSGFRKYNLINFGRFCPRLIRQSCDHKCRHNNMSPRDYSAVHRPSRVGFRTR